MIGLVGSGNVENLCSQSGLDQVEVMHKIEKLGKVLAGSGDALLFCPIKGSTEMEVAKFYKKFGGAELVGLVPLDDAEFGIDICDSDICDVVLNTDVPDYKIPGTWRNYCASLVGACDRLFVVGGGPSALAALANIPLFGLASGKGKCVEGIIIKDFIEGDIHAGLFDGIPVKMLSLEKIQNAFSS